MDGGGGVGRAGGGDGVWCVCIGGGDGGGTWVCLFLGGGAGL